MTTKKLEYNIIPLSDRPKLFQEMQDNPYDLSPLNLKTILTYLDSTNERKNKLIREKNFNLMSFKFYSEFLNMINSSILFYELNYYMLLSSLSGGLMTLFMILDLSVLFFSMIFFLLSKQKQKTIQAKYLIIYGFINIFSSKYFTTLGFVETSIKKYKKYTHLTLHKIVSSLPGKKFMNILLDNSVPLFFYINIDYFIFLIPFLLSNDYFANTSTNTNLFTKLLYNILIFIMSIMHDETYMKIRCLLLGINFFEFIPEIRKFANSCSGRIEKITYLVNIIIDGIILYFIREKKILITMVIANVIFIIVYPIFFNYYYHREKLFIKGMWDVPELTSFN